MVWKRKGSRYWYLGPRKAGGIAIPRLSTGVRDKATARAIDLTLDELATTGWADLVEQAARGDLPLVELYTAKVRGREALESLRQRATDPLLADAIARLLPSVRDKGIVKGLDHVTRFAPAGARMSWLLVPRNVTEMYERAMSEGRKPNTVRRSLHRAVATLLAREYGRGRMLAVMADATVPSENDERRVLLTVDEARRALELADPEFRPVLGYALTTGIDRMPMLAQRVYHYDEEAGTVFVPDTKAKDRARTLSLRGVPVLENAEYWLRMMIAGRKPDAPLVPVTSRQVRTRWEAIRADLGRADVRWKDLRGNFATYCLLAGVEPRELQAIMGHSGMAMTLRYLRRLPAGNRENLREHARTFGLPYERGYLRAETRA